MDRLIVKGPTRLSGKVEVSGAKNAALPLMAASILYPGEVTFSRIPDLSDTRFFANILESLGAKTSNVDGDLTIDCSDLTSQTADYDLVRKMRASVLVLGPTLARFGKAKVSLPGGCAIGSRPVDIHLYGLRELGAEIEIEQGYIVAKANRLVGTSIVLPSPSVGATENIMMAAALAEGETQIDNAAREPEVSDLASFLVSLGVEISGIGSSTLVIKGKKISELRFSPKSYEVIGDRIEALTFVAAGLICQSEIEVTGFNPDHLKFVFNLLKKMGAKLEVLPNGVRTLVGSELNYRRIETAPYPGLPTDTQAQMMTLMSFYQGGSIREHIFENRFMHVPELTRMGHKISIDYNTALIEPSVAITGAQVMCTDLRASAALVLSALGAKGESVISRIYHLDRGYERLEQKLLKLGANIERTR